MYNPANDTFSHSKLTTSVRCALQSEYVNYNPNGNNLSPSQRDFSVRVALQIIEDFNNGISKINLIFAPPQSGKTGINLEIIRIIVNSYLDGKLIMDEEFRRDSSDILSYMFLHTSDTLLKNQQENRIATDGMNRGKYRLKIVQRDDWKKINEDTDDPKIVLISADESHEGNVEGGQVFKLYKKLGYEYCSKPNSKTIVIINSASPCGHLLDAINNPDNYNIFIPPLELNYLSPQLLFKMNRVRTLDKNIFSYKKNSHTIDINYDVINDILEGNYPSCIQNKKSTGEIILNSSKIKDNKYIIVRISSSLLPNNKESVLIRSLSKVYKFSGSEKEKQVFDVKYINSYHGNIDELIEILDHKPAKLTFLIIRNALKRGATPNTGYLASFIDLTKDGASTIQGGFGRMLGYVSQKESQSYSRKEDKFSIYLYTKSYKNLYNFYTSLENIYTYLKENNTYLLPPDMYKLLTYIPSSIDNKEYASQIVKNTYIYRIFKETNENKKNLIELIKKKRFDIHLKKKIGRVLSTSGNIANDGAIEGLSKILNHSDFKIEERKSDDEIICSGTLLPRNGSVEIVNIIDGLSDKIDKQSSNFIIYKKMLPILNTMFNQKVDGKYYIFLEFSNKLHIENNNDTTKKFKKRRVFK